MDLEKRVEILFVKNTIIELLNALNIVGWEKKGEGRANPY